MKLSIVTAVLNSHEVVRRQILHYKKINLSPDVEIVFVDDGSDPSLKSFIASLGIDFYPTILETHNTGDWTQPAARNFGVKHAKGEYVIVTDIDHIISKELIDIVLTTEYDKINFKREAGVIDENGEFTQDMGVLMTYGFPQRRLRLSAHSNSYAIRKGLFIGLGGSQQKDHYPNRDEVSIKRKLKQLNAEGKIKIIPDDDRPTIYMIPNGRFCGDKDYNPFGLFHNLTRKTKTPQQRKGRRSSLSFYRKTMERRAKETNHIVPLPPYFNCMIGDKKRVRIADLGAGPLPITGSTWDGVDIEIIASDFSADEYNQMLLDAKITPVIPVENQIMEDLTYPNASFDIVHCVNALDHTENPKKAINEMLRICKPGGWIYLRHFIDEGLNQKYKGLHNWNISNDGSVWNDESNFNLQHFGFTTESGIYKGKSVVVSWIKR